MVQFTFRFVAFLRFFLMRFLLFRSSHLENGIMLKIIRRSKRIRNTHTTRNRTSITAFISAIHWQPPQKNRMRRKLQSLQSAYTFLSPVFVSSREHLAHRYSARTLRTCTPCQHFWPGLLLQTSGSTPNGYHADQA